MKNKKRHMRFHIYGQPGLFDLPETTTIQDLRTLAWFNRFIKSYLKMQIIANKER